MERGESASNPMHSVNDISTSATKVACLQATHRRADGDSPVSAEVDPNMLTPLLREAPSMLKNYLVGRQNKIKRDVMYNEALKDPQAPRRPITTWAELLHD